MIIIARVDQACDPLIKDNPLEIAVRFGGLIKAFLECVKNENLFYLRIVSHEFQLEGIHDIGSQQGQRDINDLMGEADLVILDNLSTLDVPKK